MLRPALTRALCGGLAVGLAGVATAGCAGFNKAFGKREAIVMFKQGTPTSVRLTVRAACSHLPQASPEPLPTDNKLSDYLNDVRYRIDDASDGQLMRLERCLTRFPAVAGIENPQDDNS
jgi:hypothetical protein